MNYYQEITLLPEQDITIGFIWQKVFQQVHIALVENKIDEKHSAIALSFPDYGKDRFPLGGKLRLLAQEKESLDKLDITKWLNRLIDYVHIKSVRNVPETKSFACFLRENLKGETRIEKNMQIKAKRWSEKSGKPLQECLAELEKSKPKIESYPPFVWCESQETKRCNPENVAKFPLYIKKIEVESMQVGKINCYGLAINNSNKGKIASVPLF